MGGAATEEEAHTTMSRERTVMARTATLFAFVFYVASLSAMIARASEGQHPYFPVKLGSTWMYQFPSFNAPDKLTSAVAKVTKVDDAEHTYTIEETMHLGTVPPITGTWFYELRAGNILSIGATTAVGGSKTYAIAPILLQADLTKGMHWKAGAPDPIRDCSVVDFITLKVPSGEYTHVAKILVNGSYIDPATNQEKHALTTYEYYAPDVGLIKVEVLEQSGQITTYQELVSYSQ